MELDDYLNELPDLEEVDNITPPEDIQVNDPIIEDNLENIPPAEPPTPIVETPPVIEDDDPETRAHFEALRELGILDLPEDFEYRGKDSLDEALNVTQSSMQTRAINGLWNSLPEEFRPLLQYALQGGTSLEEYMNAFAPKDFTFDLEDEISQREIIKEYYRQTNPRLTEEKLDQMVARREQAGSLREEAEDALQFLDDLKEERKISLFEELEAEKARAEAEQAARDNAIKASIDNFSNDSIRRNRLKNFLFNPIKQGENVTTEFNESLNSILTNHDHLVQLVDILADYDARVGFNFDRLSKRIKTETTKNYKDRVSSKLDSKSSVKGSPAKTDPGDFDWDKYFGKK